jgi:hypothetical protein
MPTALASELARAADPVLSCGALKAGPHRELILPCSRDPDERPSMQIERDPEWIRAS